MMKKTHQKKKAMSFEKLAYLIFALVGAAIILLIFFSRFNPQSTMFCTVYSGIYAILPTGDSPPPLPRSCLGEPEEVYDTEHIYLEGKSEVTEKLVDLIVSCWQNNKAYPNREMPCYTINIAALNGSISEVDITDDMAASGFICDTLENSVVVDPNGKEKDYNSISKKSCGKKDQIGWSVDGNLIHKGDYVQIKYLNSTIRIIS